MIITTEMLYGTPCEMLQKKMVIYMMRSLIDGKIYVGKTARKLYLRIREHIKNGRNPKCTSHIDRAINTHGIENFDVIILEECETEAELDPCEMKWIKAFDCKAPNGLNLTDGGEGCTGYKAPPELRAKFSKMRKGGKLSLEHRQKMSKTRRGRTLSMKHRESISKGRKGVKTKPHSAEIRQKMANSSPFKKAVRCIETGTVFESITAASKWAGVNHKTIRVALRKSTRTAGGYHWEYVNGSENISGKRPVRCVETEQIFESAVEASKWVGVTPSVMNSVLQKRTFTAGGYHWEYIQVDEAQSLPSKTESPKAPPKKQGRRPIKCVETNEVFVSLSAASKAKNISRFRIREVLNISRIAGGYHWVDASIDEVPIEDNKTPKISHRPVKCVETNEVFEAISAASRFANVAPSRIKEVLNHSSNTAGGYHWVDA